MTTLENLILYSQRFIHNHIDYFYLTHYIICLLELSLQMQDMKNDQMKYFPS